MATYTVVVPSKADAQFTRSWKGEVVGIPFLGEARRYILTEEEFEQWIEQWRADKSMGSMFYVERHAR